MWRHVGVMTSKKNWHVEQQLNVIDHLCKESTDNPLIPNTNGQ